MRVKRSFKADRQYYFRKFHEGDEKGLEFFYRYLYPPLFYRGRRFIKDDFHTDCIVKEAFLRLWIIRSTITDADHIENFVKKHTREGCLAYYRTPRNRFRRNMLRLDNIENYQEFMAGYDPEEDEDTDTLYQQELDEEMKKQWEQVEMVLPNLPENQQLFIRLCLKYSFNYDRIAWHIGGISNYVVARKVEKTLESLKSVIVNTTKLDEAAKIKRFRFEGDLTEEQAKILNMRYELQYSFEEIASDLGLSRGYVQKAFVLAYTAVKKVKK